MNKIIMVILVLGLIFISGCETAETVQEIEETKTYQTQYSVRVGETIATHSADITIKEIKNGYVVVEILETY